ncbi:hypothetical protein AVEN_12845-1 [Araneus ventricosus]|uniref:Uncharacterized protein n=1 Tax=Araneus ventricosus TaxID=182803 RepID=A0A4Y2EE17_ARAVE|nr:hypothetical protein AVEN_12845-1 [Araneus ventricosus]
MVRSQLRSRRVLGTKSDSIEGPPCMWACCKLNHTQRVKRPPAGVMRKLGGGMSDQVSSTVSDLGSKLRGPSKIALVLLQNGTLR